MKKVFYDSWFARLVLCLSSCHTIMLFGFVFSKRKESEISQSTRNHECTHARQWFETTALFGALFLAIVLAFGVTPWLVVLSGLMYYVWYVIEWLIKLVIYNTFNTSGEKPNAYKNLSFEREARLSERDAHYLENSDYFAWLRHL